MSLAALIRSMAAAGAPPEAIALAVEAVEAAESKDAARREAARDKKRRQRAGHGGDSPGTVPGQIGDSPDPPPEVRPLSPQTPLTPTPTPPDITTRGREERMREEAGWTVFWDAYPRKVSKAEARKAFLKAWRKLPPFDEIGILTGGLERAKAGWDDAQFIPHAATWLNQERWQDEAPVVVNLKPRRDHERPHPDAKFAARQANLATLERGADLAARLHRQP